MCGMVVSMSTNLVSTSVFRPASAGKGVKGGALGIFILPFLILFWSIYVVVLAAAALIKAGSAVMEVVVKIVEARRKAKATMP